MLGRTLGPRCRRFAAAVALGLAAAGLGLAPLSASAAGLPDLMLGGSFPASVARGTTFTYSVKLHNDGPVASPTPSVMGTLHRDFQILNVGVNDPSFTCDFKNDDFVFGEIWACASTSPLASQGTAIVKITVRAPATASAHTYQNGADPNNLVAESDEGNNILNRPISVT
jgi:hypothetical protein